MSGALLPAAVAGRFFLPSGAVYLKSHSVGCQPRSAEALRKNPLGLYVNAIAWSRELDPATPPEGRIPQ